MVNEATRKFRATLCSCGVGFQGDRFEEHAKTQREKGFPNHTKAQRTMFCGVCNVFGKEGEPFPHSKCIYVGLIKSDIKEAALGRRPLHLEEAVAKAKKREEEKKAKKAAEELARKREEEKAAEEKRQKEVDAAVATIGGSEEDVMLELFGVISSEGEVGQEAEKEGENEVGQEAEEGENEVEKEAEKEDELSSSDSESESEKSDSEEVNVARTLKRVRVIRSSSEDDDSAPEKRPRTSTPIPLTSPPQPAAFVPRNEAAVATQRRAIQTLTDSNAKQKRRIEILLTDVAILKEKEKQQKRFEADVAAMKVKVASVEEEKKKGDARIIELEALLAKERKEREVERKEMEDLKRQAKEQAELAERAVTKMRGEMEEEKLKVKDRDRKIAALEKKEKPGLVTVHVACQDGRLGENFIDEHDADSSIVCFSDEGRKVRCHHIVLKTTQADVKLKNVRWPSESRKFKDNFNLTKF